MPYFVGLDVSKKTTSICVIDAEGATVEETVAETTPRAIVAALRGGGRRYRRVGMEASSMAAWLFAGLAKAGLPIISIDPRHAHAVLSTRHNKTDRNDAAGIAELMRIGTYKPAHIRSPAAREIRALLVAREALVAKRRDIDGVLRSLLLGFGLKVQRGGRKSFADRVEALVARYPAAAALRPLLRVRHVLNSEIEAFDLQVKEAADNDAVCQRLQTAPGVGPLGALAYRSVIDEPNRFPSSRAVGVHLGLTPRTYQSGDRSAQGRITHAGDRMTRKLLFLAACVLSQPGKRESWLSRWAKTLIDRMHYKRAMVAVARKLAIVLHRMWVTETDFQWERAA